MGIQIYQGMGSLSTCSNYQRPEIKLVSGEEVRRQDQEQQESCGADIDRAREQSSPRVMLPAKKALALINRRG